ncbi:MAG: AI-2E family transporter [Gemmatimonadetes bacterium]|nr:AI-2E family transporter [Gemmatimonadota bacterium]MDA1102612.1 AI-2E family transporter [Gemmatimonadota bacterium]
MTEGAPITLWRVVQATAVIVVLTFFLLQTLSILNPVLLFIVLWAMLLPFRGKEGHTALLTVAAILAGLWILSETDTLLAPFVLSLVLAYILDPLVDRLAARGLSRTLAVMALMVPAVASLAAVALILIPAAFGQLGEVLQAAPILFERLGQWIESGQQRLLAVDIPLFDGAEVVAQIRSVDSGAVVEFLQERQAALANYVWGGILGLGRGIGSIITVVGYVVLTPVLTFYLIRDWDTITARIADLMPARRRDAFVAFSRECDGLVSSYLRGQVTVAISIGLITGVGLALVSFPYAASLGLMVGLFSIVPYLGLILSLVPAIFIALVSGSVGVSLLKVAVVYTLAQILDGTLITPRIVGDSVGIHPVWIVLALSLGGFFFGFVGLMIGVPAAAVTKLLLVRALDRYRSSDFYRGSSAPG